MKKNTIIVTALLTVMLFGGCGNNNNAQESDSAINAVAEENAQESSGNSGVGRWDLYSRIYHGQQYVSHQ